MQLFCCIEFVIWCELRHGVNALLCDELKIKLDENIISFLTLLSHFCYLLLCVCRKYANWMLVHCHPDIHKTHNVTSTVKEVVASSWLRQRGLDRLLGQYSDTYLILFFATKRYVQLITLYLRLGLPGSLLDSFSYFWWEASDIIAALLIKIESDRPSSVWSNMPQPQAMYRIGSGPISKSSQFSKRDFQSWLKRW